MGTINIPVKTGMFIVKILKIVEDKSLAHTCISHVDKTGTCVYFAAKPMLVTRTLHQEKECTASNLLS